MADRVNARFVGQGRDQDGIEVDVLVDSVTGQQLLAYSVENWLKHIEVVNARRTLTRVVDRPAAAGADHDPFRSPWGVN